MSHVTVTRAVRGGIAAVLVTLLLVAGSSRAATKEMRVLHIGATEAVVEESVPEGSDETSVEATYQQFIQEATGFGSDIVGLDNHEVLAERLASGKLQLGVFMGYEFAWAQARYPKLKVLAVSVNHHEYRYPALVVRRDGPISDLAGLKGKSLALPRMGEGYGRLFVAAQGRVAGQDPGALLGHIDTFEDAETPLDDVVDETDQAAVVDRLSLEAYERRKPGRFARLKMLSESKPMPPALIAYYDGNLDPATVTRLRNDLIKAREQEQGEHLLMLFRLTSFAAPSPDFERVLADTRKIYPAPALRKRTEAHPLLSAATTSLDKGPETLEPEYYLSVFASDTVPRHSQYSHTFATFIKSSGGSVEAHTISWLPKSGQIEVARTQSEPGMNLDLRQSLRFARDQKASVFEWGPYRIRPELYERSLRQIERLNSGRIQYKVLDGAWRPDAASNCIHAVSDIDTDNGCLTVDGAFGALASAGVVEHLSRWMIQPGLEHPSIQEKLGLSGQPITHVAYYCQPPVHAPALAASSALASRIR
jgi:ABC-type phosphate/phosphonate transport system substrate-binding protein